MSNKQDAERKALHEKQEAEIFRANLLAKLQKNIPQNGGSWTVEPITDPTPSWMQESNQGLQLKSEDASTAAPKNCPSFKCIRTFADGSKGEAIYNPKTGVIRVDLNDDASVRAGFQIAGRDGVLQLKRPTEDLTEQQKERLIRIAKEEGVTVLQSNGEPLLPSPGPAPSMAHN